MERAIRACFHGVQVTEPMTCARSDSFCWKGLRFFVGDEYPRSPLTPKDLVESALLVVGPALAMSATRSSLLPPIFTKLSLARLQTQPSACPALLELAVREVGLAVASRSLGSLVSASLVSSSTCPSLASQSGQREHRLEAALGGLGPVIALSQAKIHACPSFRLLSPLCLSFRHLNFTMWTFHYVDI